MQFYSTTISEFRAGVPTLAEKRKAGDERLLKGKER
jgi:hypothetical protein